MTKKMEMWKKCPLLCFCPAAGRRLPEGPRHDLHTGSEQRFAFEDGVFGSETAMAPRVGSTGEDDGYLVTITTDMNADESYCLVFDAARVSDGPVC